MLLNLVLLHGGVHPFVRRITPNHGQQGSVGVRAVDGRVRLMQGEDLSTAQNLADLLHLSPAQSSGVELSGRAQGMCPGLVVHCLQDLDGLLIPLLIKQQPTGCQHSEPSGCTRVAPVFKYVILETLECPVHSGGVQNRI